MTRKTNSKTTQSTPVINLPHFAKKVMEVARYAPEEFRFGPNKAYISKVWELGFKDMMTLEQFKEYLKQAHIQGLLYLSRADLIQVMNQQWVKESEIQLAQGLDTAVVNFVLIV